MLQKSRAALGAGVGDLRAIGDEGILRLIAYTQLGQIVSIIADDETLPVGFERSDDRLSRPRVGRAGA